MKNLFLIDFTKLSNNINHKIYVLLRRNKSRTFAPLKFLRVRMCYSEVKVNVSRYASTDNTTNITINKNK